MPVRCVAGVCALVLSANPDLSSEEVRDIVRSTARKIGSPGDYVNGHSVKFGHGCADAERAVAEALARAGGTGSPPGAPVPQVA